jgi:hypothetical protein
VTGGSLAGPAAEGGKDSIGLAKGGRLWQIIGEPVAFSKRGICDSQEEKRLLIRASHGGENGPVNFHDIHQCLAQDNQESLPAGWQCGQ